MKLLLATRFYPNIGGLETVMQILADEWTAAGHEVRVATDVLAPPPGAERSFAYPVDYCPGAVRMLSLVKWCDTYVQACIGLKTLWPLGIFRRRYVAIHHTWYQRIDGSRGWPERVKHRVARHALNIACSQAVADHLEAPCVVIPNPYRVQVFKRLAGVVCDRDLIFVGRLVSDKGAALLLQAVAKLADDGLRPGLTIVGDGPERPALARQAAELGLDSQVEFTGSKSPDEVAALLNRHRVFVVPSLWDEPFGVVALEGIACGCLVVGSSGGGLKDAIGPCGLTFPNGDMEALAAVLQEVLNRPGYNAVDPAVRARHLERHRPAAVARQYLETIGSHQWG